MWFQVYKCVVCQQKIKNLWTSEPYGSTGIELDPFIVHPSVLSITLWPLHYSLPPSITLWPHPLLYGPYITLWPLHYSMAPSITLWPLHYSMAPLHYSIAPHSVRRDTVLLFCI